MVAERERAQARLTPELSNHHHHQDDDSTTTCAFCGAATNIYQLGAAWICADHLAESVALAACDVWPNMVSYSREFEAVIYA